MDYSEINLKFEHFDSICRFCLNREMFLKPIFVDENSEHQINEDELTERSISNMIEKCTKIKILRMDRLPKYACGECLDQLLKCYYFRKQCIKSDEILKNIVEHYRNEKNEIFTNDLPIEICIKNEDIEETSSYRSNISEEPLRGSEEQTQNESDNHTISEIRRNKKRSRLGIKKKRNKCGNRERNHNKYDSLKHKSERIHSEKDNVDESNSKSQLKQCQICGKMAKGIKLHMLTHTGEKSHNCSICGKNFSLKFNLNRHMKIHFNQREYKCDVCEKGFNDPKSLKVHYVRHTGEKNFVCDVCHEAFRYPNSLSRHRRSHFQDRRYECGTCHKWFYTKSCLKKHNRSHTGEKPYQCEYCPKRCSQSGSLIMHTKIHTNGAPYKCSVCESSFVYKADLNEHFKSHDREDGKIENNQTKENTDCNQSINLESRRNE